MPKDMDLPNIPILHLSSFLLQPVDTPPRFLKTEELTFVIQRFWSSFHAIEEPVSSIKTGGA